MKGRTSQLAAWARRWAASCAPGSKLPADRELAHAWGVSVMSVRRALCTLAAQGVMERRQGAGTFAPRPVPAEAAQGATPAEAGGLYAHLRAAIGRGEFKRGEDLPSYKTLRGAFAVSTRTIRDAYARLVADGLAVRAGKRCRAGTFIELVRRPPRNTILFYRGPRLDVSTFFSTHEAAMAFNKMERELAGYGYRIRFGRYETFESDMRRWLGDGSFPQGLLLTGNNELGTMNPEDYEPLRAPLRKLLRETDRMRPRVLVLSTFYRPPDPFIHTFSISHAIVAMRRKLARFVADNGFPRTTYFYCETTHNRHLFIDALRLIPELDHLRPGFPLRLAVRPCTGDLSREQFIRRLTRRYPLEHVTTRLSKYRPIAFNDIADRIALAGDFTQYYQSEQLPALWIFEQEAAAVEALDWCARRRVAVPRDVSVIGLENRRDFAECGISACVRDWDTMGYLMAHTLIGDIPLRTTHRGFIAYDALLLARATTA